LEDEIKKMFEIKKQILKYFEDHSEIGLGFILFIATLKSQALIC
jgi:hypothetical protein